MNIYSLSVLLFTFGVLLTAVLALAKRRDLISIRFAIFSIGVCGWGTLYAIWTSQNLSRESMLILIRVSELFAVFIPITWTHFVFDFVQKREPFRFFYISNYTLAGILAALCLTPYFFTGVHPVPIFNYYKTAGPVFYVFLSLYFVLVPYGFWHLVKAYRTSAGPAKEQLKLILISWLVSFAAGTTTFLPVFNITSQLYLLLFMPLYPFLIGLALIRHGLFDFQQIADAFQREKMTALGVMAASLNHELRNPLYIAKGKIESYLDAVNRGIYSQKENMDKANEVTNAALNQLTRAMDIIQKFSDFSKPASVKNDREKIVLSKFLEDVNGLISNELELKKIHLNQNFTNDMCVVANRRQLEEVFFNLITNACQAMEQGGELRVHASQPNGKIRIEISDTGHGIEGKNLTRIFDPFYSTKGQKGSGLGLYITKQLVERNGGKIKVESKPGIGTKFLLEFAAL